MPENSISARSRLAALGGVGAALASGFCCIGTPLSAAGVVGAAGVAAGTGPLTPVVLLLAASFLMFAFRPARKEPRVIAKQACARSNLGFLPTFLWVATALAVILAYLPLWISLVR